MLQKVALRALNVCAKACGIDGIHGVKRERQNSSRSGFLAHLLVLRQAWVTVLFHKTRM